MLRSVMSMRLSVVAWILAPSLLAAQSSEKITISGAPAPNQTIHFHIEQDMDMEFVIARTPADPSAGGTPTRMGGRTLIESTLSVGAPDAQGRIVANLVYDSITANMNVNGSPMPVGDAVAPLQGQTLTATYDARGTLIDAKGPESLAASGVNFKDLLMTLAGHMPASRLGIGETAAIPLDIPFPLPMPGAQAAHLTGQGVYKLTAITRDGAARIADLDFQIDTKMTTEMPVGAGPSMTMDVRMNGGGPCQWNVERGYMKRSDQKMTFEGTFSGGPMDMAIHGTMRVQTEGSPGKPSGAPK